MNQQLNIGLFGFGVVGHGLYEVLKQSRATQAVISKICIKNRNKQRPLPPGMFTYDPDDILKDRDINLVVELIDDAEAAYLIVKSALEKGKSVVSGNKKMLAAHLPEFISIQQKHGVGLLYDASACGSIPVIRNLEEYYDNDLLQSVTGILNGSSNYILSKMFNQGLDYTEALCQAQELGFAESDPVFDVGGLDALYKLVIITVHAFGVYVSPGEVFNSGISNINGQDMQFAREKGRKIKLVAQVKKSPDNRLSLYVMPRMVSPDKYIYNVEDEFNGVVIKGAFYDKQFMFGKGAGAYPTGSAVLSDITARSYNYRYEYKKMKLTNGLTFSNQAIVPVYLRYNHESDLSLFRFEEIRERYNSEGFRYVTGLIKLENLQQIKTVLKGRNVFLAEI
ncbi:MAG: homoserine dehydrogenase [Bacteroidales bacterium]|jgi:homoserine dehydrogenase|nr:homoserine dehydrogenase [Bacteroidales bacterium]